MICIEVVFHKWYNEGYKFLLLGKIFLRQFFLKFELLSYRH